LGLFLPLWQLAKKKASVIIESLVMNVNGMIYEILLNFELT
jgi:hypothetical protein